MWKHALTHALHVTHVYMVLSPQECSLRRPSGPDLHMLWRAKPIPALQTPVGLQPASPPTCPRSCAPACCLLGAQAEWGVLQALHVKPRQPCAGPEQTEPPRPQQARASSLTHRAPASASPNSKPPGSSLTEGVWGKRRGRGLLSPHLCSAWGPGTPGLEEEEAPPNRKCFSGLLLQEGRVQRGRGRAGDGLHSG